MRILRLEPDDVIIPPFAVISVIVASQGQALLRLTLFSFCGESGTVSDWTDPLVLEGDEDMDCSFFLVALCL